MIWLHLEPFFKSRVCCLPGVGSPQNKSSPIHLVNSSTCQKRLWVSFGGDVFQSLQTEIEYNNFQPQEFALHTALSSPWPGMAAGALPSRESRFRKAVVGAGSWAAGPADRCAGPNWLCWAARKILFLQPAESIMY